VTLRSSIVATLICFGRHGIVKVVDFKVTLDVSPPQMLVAAIDSVRSPEGNSSLKSDYLYLAKPVSKCVR
jgi:hypothetical protein